MIRFKHKIFAVPLIAGAASALGSSAAVNGLTAASIGMQGVGMIQGNKQAAAAEEQQAQALLQQKKSDKMAQQNAKMQADALNKLANKNPQLGAQVAKTFSAPMIMKNIGQVAKDMWTVGNKNGAIRKRVAHGVAMGATMGALAYGTNKFIAKDARKNGLLPGKNDPELQKSAAEDRKNTLKKVATGALAIGGTLAAVHGANKGMFGQKAQQFVKTKLPSTTKLKSTGSAFSKDLVHGFKDQFTNPSSTVMTLGFGVGLPAIGYMKERSQMKDQVNQSTEPQQKTYAIPATAINTFGKGLKNFAKAPVKKTLSGMSSFMQTGGEKGLNNFTKQLTQQGVKSQAAGGSDATLKVANFMNNHKKTALVGSIGVGAMLFKPWGWGEKVVSKGVGLVDKDANAYTKFKEKQVQQ